MLTLSCDCLRKTKASRNWTRYGCPECEALSILVEHKVRSLEPSEEEGIPPLGMVALGPASAINTFGQIVFWLFVVFLLVFCLSLLGGCKWRGGGNTLPWSISLLDH